MRSTTKAKLDKAIRIQWFKRAAAAGGVVLIIAAGLWYTGLDSSVHNQRVKGVVEKVSAASGISTQAVETALAVSVKLDDGRVANVLAIKESDPKIGQAVEITEHIHGSGRSTFSWK
ncbi:MAG: hypothetical protein ABL894_11810 [Hyphomicrobium sp.]